MSLGGVLPMKGLIPFTDSPDFTCWEPEIRGFDRAGICLDQGDKSTRGFWNQYEQSNYSCSIRKVEFSWPAASWCSFTEYHIFDCISFRKAHIKEGGRQERCLTLMGLCIPTRKLKFRQIHFSPKELRALWAEGTTKSLHSGGRVYSLGWVQTASGSRGSTQ